MQRRARPSILSLFGLLGVLVISTWLTLVSANGHAEAAASTAASPERQAGRPIQVFFSRRPESDGDFAAVFPVSRTAPDAGVARAALHELIAGPTPAEQDVGYFAELGQMLYGPSTCGDDGFTIRIADGVATVRFCRGLRSGGIGQDARLDSTVKATLTQFPTIQRVRLLDQDGNCLLDMSGLNRCLVAI